jgi:hypothetical protein
MRPEERQLAESVIRRCIERYYGPSEETTATAQADSLSERTRRDERDGSRAARDSVALVRRSAVDGPAPARGFRAADVRDVDHASLGDLRRAIERRRRELAG